MQPQIQLVHFQITKNCNLRCWFCGQWGKKGFFADDKGSQVSYEKWLEIVNELYNYGKKVGRLPDIMIWGGEPLICPFFDDLVLTLKQKGFNLGMVTNGVFINEHAKIINDCFKVIYVSIDGVKSVHDSIRGDGVYDKVLSNLKLISNNVKIRVMSVVTKSLLDNFTCFTSELSTANIEKLILQDIICLNKAEADNYANILKTEFNQSAESISGWVGNAENLRNDINNLLSKNYAVKVEYLPHDTVADRCCLSSFNHIHIAWNGNLLFCTDFYDFSFANANDGSVVDAFYGETANKFRNLLQNNDLPTCKHCSWKNSKEFYL